MNDRKRLYSTVKEERQREALKRRFGLANTAIAKGAGMPKGASQDEVRRPHHDRDLT